MCVTCAVLCVSCVVRRVSCDLCARVCDALHALWLNVSCVMRATHTAAFRESKSRREYTSSLHIHCATIPPYIVVVFHEFPSFLWKRKPCLCLCQLVNPENAFCECISLKQVSWSQSSILPPPACWQNSTCLHLSPAGKRWMPLHVVVLSGVSTVVGRASLLHW